MKKIKYILLFALLAIWACNEKTDIQVDGQYCPILPGDPVSFTMDMGSDIRTKSSTDYTPVDYSALYRFDVEMFKDGIAEKIGNAVYIPEPDENNIDGTLILADEQDPLFWEDNVNAYGFKVTAGGTSVIDKTSGTGDDLFCDQSTQELWTSYDKLLGYAAVGEDDKTSLNHHKIQEWFAQNKADYAAAGLLASDEDLMKIPLYLDHQRAMITVILKAAEGVRREDLQFLTQEENIDMRIFQKSGTSDMVPVKALAEEAEIEYAQDINGPAGTYNTTSYHAIVEPYNYIDVAETDPICTVNLSGQKFSFYASSDTRYNSYKEGNGLTDEEREEFEKAYNLQAGKHVVITATLSRESRKILMTAYVMDWEEIVTSTICDDYGKNGDPIQISTVEELKTVLDDPEQNLTGNVLLVTSDLTLPSDWNVPELKCMLNLAGHTINTSTPLFQKISDSGSIVNGSINVTGNVPYAIAQENQGTLERVNVKADSGVKASVAGMVQTNWRTIYNCTSSLPVYGNPASVDSDNPNYVGGIAAEMKQNGTVKPIIDGCVVDAKVDGNSNVAAGGGIVGNATGRVSNNTYEYGITISQNAEKFKDIVSKHEGYAAEQILVETNNYGPQGYSGIIDCQTELAMLFENSSVNSGEKKYRIAGDFTVDQTWNISRCDHTLGTGISGNVLFALDGNGKTVTLLSNDAGVSAPMLFTNIQGSISDLNICVSSPLFKRYEVPQTNADTRSLTFDDFCSVAPLAYGVSGGRITNVKVYTTNSSYIQASNAAGIAVWAINGAVFESCEFYGEIRGYVDYDGVSSETIASNMNLLRQGSSYLASGGIAAAAETATFNRCVFHNQSTVSLHSGSEKSRSYIGGIVGSVINGTADESTPSIILEDCTSYLTGTTSVNTGTESYGIGALVGNSIFWDNRNQVSGINSGKCQGNWWSINESYAVSLKINNRTDVQTVGKRNSVTPQLDRSWFE